MNRGRLPTDRCRPLTGNRLERMSGRTPSAGTPHHTSCRRPGSQPESSTEVSLGVRGHTPSLQRAHAPPDTNNGLTGAGNVAGSMSSVPGLTNAHAGGMARYPSTLAVSSTMRRTGRWYVARRNWSASGFQLRSQSWRMAHCRAAPSSTSTLARAAAAGSALTRLRPHRRALDARGYGRVRPRA
jgi:hypothetical protein